MTRLAMIIGLLATIGLAAATPARADFAVVKFKSGWCRVWSNTAFAPPDGHFLWWHSAWHHHHWYYRLPTWADAHQKLHTAIAWHRCRP